MMRFPSMRNGRSSTDASSAFASGDSYSEDSDDDDCQVVGVRLPPRAVGGGGGGGVAAAAAASPGASQKSGNSSWSAWEVKPCGKRPGVRPQAKAGNGHAGPELVDDNQQNLRRQWEAATLRRRTCPPMRSEGSKAGTNGHWGPHAPASGSIHRETDSSANLGGESGTAETVQSNGHVSPVKDVSLHTLSETTSTSADSVVQGSVVEPRENGDAEPDEVASGSRKRPAPAPAPATDGDDHVLPESSSNSVFRSREDPPLKMESPPKFARASHSMDVKKGIKRRYEPEDVHDATLPKTKLRTNGTDGASISGHGGMNSLKHMDIGNQGSRDGFGVNSDKHMDNGIQSTRDGLGINSVKPTDNGHQSARDGLGINSVKPMDNGHESTRDGLGINPVKPIDNGHQSTRDAGGSEPAFGSAVEQDIVGAKEKLKETADFKLADEEEWARRQQELQKQAQEARRLRERKRAETDRKNEVELRQKQRLEEIRQTQQKEERNMGLKDQIRGKVQADLERLASGCRDMATLLRLLHIPVEGGLSPSLQQVNAAYKKALLRYHPDRTSALAQGDPQRQVEAEETFKLITRMKPILKPSSIFTAMTAR
ncbi:hypothetical protein KC19_9G186600 [Ceratodon purpureus]|uniref:J domain-containing protein n=1 Tax=Ceratodon purpureus TaxID=3225 RepID=A0A8T0GZ04_CERPU|nr:hypothetical protein KC19_9G186600 [Ceratodon purpureus]